MTMAYVSEHVFDADVIVVGAGPAGSCAALVAARAGSRVILVERGPFPGSKNMYGGVVYPRILDEIIPDWFERAPVQRWVTRRSTMILSDTGALNIDFRANAWGAPRTTAPPPTVPTSTTGWLTRPSRRERCSCATPPRPDCCATTRAA